MKTTADDFQDVLAGRQNKPEAVKQIKHDIAGAGLICKTSRRKLASGVKIYFTITPPDSLYDSPEWRKRVESVRNYTVDVIAQHFPLAGITSASASTWTVAEY